MSLEQLKALSCIVAKTPREAEKIDSTITKILRGHPELEKPFREYMKQSVGLNCNFDLERSLKEQTIYYEKKEKQKHGMV